jgi:hypothetical protein
MKKMYYIYHVPGVKVGCTTEPSIRLSSQGYSDYQLLEAYEDIYEASDREIYLQKLMKYPVDKIPYWKSVENRKEGSKIVFEKGIGIFGMSEEAKFVSRSSGGKISCKSHFKNKTGIFGMSEEAKFKRNSGACKGKVWINDGMITKKIYPEDFDKWLSKGYVKGRLKRK